MRCGGGLQCFTLCWQEKMNKAKLRICFKKLISVLNVDLQTIKKKYKEPFPTEKALERP